MNDFKWRKYELEGRGSLEHMLNFSVCQGTPLVWYLDTGEVHEVVLFEESTNFLHRSGLNVIR